MVMCDVWCDGWLIVAAGKHDPTREARAGGEEDGAAETGGGSQDTAGQAGGVAVGGDRTLLHHSQFTTYSSVVQASAVNGWIWQLLGTCRGTLEVVDHYSVLRQNVKFSYSCLDSVKCIKSKMSQGQRHILLGGLWGWKMR